MQFLLILRMQVLQQENLNGKTYLSTIKQQIMENLRRIAHAPSVQMHEVLGNLFFYSGFQFVCEKLILVLSDARKVL